MGELAILAESWLSERYRYKTGVSHKKAFEQSHKHMS